MSLEQLPPMVVTPGASTAGVVLAQNYILQQKSARSSGERAGVGV